MNVEINLENKQEIKNSKLMAVLSNLSRKEQNALRKFLLSPYFNQREDVIQLFEILVKNHKNSVELPKKEAIFKKIYPKKQFSDQTCRLLMSYLFKLVEQFLGVQEILEDETNLELKKAASYRKHKMPIFFQRSLNKIETDLEKSPLRNSQYFQYLHEMQMEQYQLISTEAPTDNLNLQSIADTIDISYLTLKLKQTCTLLSHKAVYQTDYEIGFLAEMLQYIQAKNLLAIPAINVYYHCYFMLLEPNGENHFWTFKQLLFEHGRRFSTTEIRDLYTLTINICIRQINEGEKSYFKEALDLYKEGLKQEYLLENGVLSRWAYFNIAAAGLQTGEYDWVDFFIKTYKNTLEKKYRESSFSFNLARLEYARKNYALVMELLQKSNYRDLLANLGAKTLLLKVYFEMEEFDLLHSHLDAMKNYIRRKHVIGYHRKNYMNIVKYAQRLMVLNPFDLAEKKQLKMRIEEEEILTERAWFLAQIT